MKKCLIETKGNLKTLKVLKDGKYFNLHSNYNPQKEAEVYVDTMNIEKDGLIVLIGCGFGYVAAEIIKRMTIHNMLIILETDIDIYNACKSHITETIATEDRDNVNYVFIDNVEDVFNTFSDLENYSVYVGVGRTITQFLPVYADIWNEKIKQLLSGIRNYVIHIKLEKNTRVNYKERWLEIMLENSKYAFDGYDASTLFGKFKNKPIVIVSAGPSLDKNVHLLKGMEDKIIIICVYTALRSLYKKGIRPHFVMALDLVQPLYKDCYNDIPLFFLSSTSPEFLGAYRGKKFMTHAVGTPITNIIFEKHIEETETPLITSGGSVACSALDVAVKLGANPTILIGQDLSFSGESTHAESTYYNEPNSEKPILLNESLLARIQNENVNIKNGRKEVTDIYGNTVYCGSMFIKFKEWFERYAEEHADAVEFINATEGGVLKKGFKIMDLSEVLSQYCTEDIGVEAVLSEVFEGSKMVSYDEKEEIIEFFLKTKEDIETCLPLAKKALKYSQDLERLYKYTDTPKASRVNKIIAALDDIDKDFHGLIKDIKLIALEVSQIYENLFKCIDTEDNEGTIAAKKNISLYENCADALERMLPLVENTIDEFRSLGPSTFE